MALLRFSIVVRGASFLVLRSVCVLERVAIGVSTLAAAFGSLTARLGGAGHLVCLGRDEMVVRVSRPFIPIS